MLDIRALINLAPFHQLITHDVFKKSEFAAFKKITDRLIDEEETQNIERIRTDDLIDAFGSLFLVRVNRGLIFVMHRILRDENRLWKVHDVERLISYLANVPIQSGDISALSFRVMSKLREAEDWKSLV